MTSFSKRFLARARTSRCARSFRASSASKTVRSATRGTPSSLYRDLQAAARRRIALHRVAYLLYRHRKTLKAKDIVVVSPNQVFNDYISSVLPDLGEENMQQTTFSQLVQEHLGGGLEIEESSAHLEYLFAKRGTPGYDLRVQEVTYKGSPAFLEAVREYVKRLYEGEGIIFPEIAYRGEPRDLPRGDPQDL